MDKRIKDKEVRKNIEQFIEEKNSSIQILILIIAIGVTVLVAIKQLILTETKNLDILFFELILTLLASIVIEIVILQIKDSAMQGKVNAIGEVVRINAQIETIWKEENELDEFFKKARKEFFISGIVIDKLIKQYKNELQMLLEKGVKVRILLESGEQLGTVTEFLYGKDYKGQESENRIRSRLQSTIDYIFSIKGVDTYILDGNLEIAVSNSPIVNPSIVAYDYSDVNELAILCREFKTAPEMSVRFYVQGVDSPNSKLKNHPTLRINSNIMNKQYNDCVEIINNMWNHKTKIETIEAIKGLYKV